MGILSGNVNARPVGVIYELEYIGLLPAYDLEITINFKSSYEYTRGHASRWARCCSRRTWTT